MNAVSLVQIFIYEQCKLNISKTKSMINTSEYKQRNVNEDPTEPLTV